MPEPFIPYILMHKNIPVAELTLDTASGAIVSIGAVWESAHVPVGIPVRKQAIDRGALNGIDEELREIVKGSLFVDETRCSALCKALKGRVRMLEEAALSAKHTVFFDSTRSDVMKDISYSGRELER